MAWPLYGTQYFGRNEILVDTSPMLETALWHRLHSHVTCLSVNVKHGRTYPDTYLSVFGNLPLIRNASARPQRLRTTCYQPKFRRATSLFIQTSRSPFTRTIGLTTTPAHTSWFQIMLLRPKRLRFTPTPRCQQDNWRNSKYSSRPHIVPRQYLLNFDLTPVTRLACRYRTILVVQ